MRAATRSPTAERSTSDLGLIAGSVAVVAWGCGPLIVASIDASTYTIAAWRLTLALPVMLLVARLTGGGVDRVMVRRSLLPGTLFGTSLLAAFASFRTTSIANATLIGAMTPVLVLLLAPRLLGERVRPPQVVAAAVSLVGIALVVVAGDSTSGATFGGDLLAVVDLALFTAYFFVIKRHRDDGVHSWSLLAAVFLVATAVVVPVCVVLTDDLLAIGSLDYGRVALMILGPGLVGHGLMTWAQRHIDMTVASLLTLASPVISAVGAWVLLSQRLGPWQVAGAAIVLAALAAIAFDSRSAHVAEAPLSAPHE